MESQIFRRIIKAIARLCAVFLITNLYGILLYEADLHHYTPKIRAFFTGTTTNVGRDFGQLVKTSGLTSLSSQPTVDTRQVAPQTNAEVPKKTAEVVYHGTSATQFSKNSVILDGKQIDGIDFLVAERGGIVTIIHSGGGLEVPASKLPQGLLNVWGITPEVLRARDQAAAPTH